MRVIVTCGPSYEPIDEVRRITNFSTGELGILLASELTRAGFRVICLKGEGATCQLPINAEFVATFGTNDHLLAKLGRIAAHEPIRAVFHAAALADFRVKTVCGRDGRALESPKLSSQIGAVTITLEPAPKLISELRPLFANAFLVGWKYELAGTCDDALAKAARQLTDAQTNLCIINGKAYGAGFGVLNRTGKVAHCPTKAGLCVRLVQTLREALSVQE